MMGRNLRVLNFFGSKVAAAKCYPTPEHDTIVEPFAGGAGYSLLHHDHRVVLIDKDPDVVDAWRYLISASPDDVAGLPLLEAGQDVRELGLARGPMLLIAWCLNQSARPNWHLSSWGAHHYHKAACFWGPRRRDQMALLCERVSHWQVYCAEYHAIADVQATWFVDPPYQGAVGRHYRHNAVDYAHLGTWCQERQGQVIVCEQAGADWLPFDPLRTAAATRACPSGGGGCKRYVEVLYHQRNWRQV